MFEKILEKNPKKDESTNISRRDFLKKAGKVALVAAGAAILGPEAVFAGKSGEGKIEQDYANDFNIGIEISEADEKRILDEMINSDHYDLESLAGGRYYNLDGYGLPYKRKAFARMVARYGKERVQKYFDVLVDAYPSELKNRDKTRDNILISYGRELPRMSEEEMEKKISLNRKLYNIANSLNEGGLEKLGSLLKKLGEEGYDKKFDFSWNGRMVDRLLSDEEERRSLIEFQNVIQDGGKGGAKYLKLKEHIGKKKFEDMTFTEKIRAFKNFDLLEK